MVSSAADQNVDSAAGSAQSTVTMPMERAMARTLATITARTGRPAPPCRLVRTGSADAARRRVACGGTGRGSGQGVRQVAWSGPEAGLPGRDRCLGARTGEPNPERAELLIKSGVGIRTLLAPP
ncbi:hypothetical protein GCM10023320_52530 [Pseudonocardia adelaidensis]|uniref:Uncharacterized protein n=1 Tax=Pseudonocardia adelaidensis TaxID=648754 RepID=A0ABP9NPS1_9PSEU